jgi:hypothetical protein
VLPGLSYPPVGGSMERPAAVQRYEFAADLTINYINMAIFAWKIFGKSTCIGPPAPLKRGQYSFFKIASNV